MPLNKPPLPLGATPESAAGARAWVTGILVDLGRADLVAAAALGVSELVTNAILHANPPIDVAVRGTRAHPRIEVRDNSLHPPEINPEMGEDESLLSTIGRGLGIVSLYSSAWGSDVGSHGKTVWFEPCRESEVGIAGNTEGDSFNFARYVERRAAAAEAPPELMRVRLLNMPVQVFADLRTRWAELRRELRLLSISHGQEYPVAVELSELFPEVELERSQSTGVSALDRAIDAGETSIDLDYRVPTSVAQTMSRLLELSGQVDQFAREERLLVLAASPQQSDLERWYFGEFVRQASGQEPLPWLGSLLVESPTSGG